MSFYPANQTSNVFNADDFISPDETTETTNGNNIEGNLDEYVRKDGTTVMTGALQVPQLFISGANSLAYTTTEKTNLNNNTNKLQNVVKTATHTEISDLKCDTIQFPIGIQNQAFTDADKTQILSNQGKLDGISNSINDIITQNKTINIKDSPEIDVVNSHSSNTKFDGALSIFRTASVYRKWWIGTIGDTINPQNTFNICVNGNHPEPESVLQLDHNGKLKIKELEINNQKSNAFTDDDKINISLSGIWVDRCTLNEYDTVFNLPISVDGDIVLKDTGKKIVLNQEEQHFAFTNALKNQIQTNTNFTNTNTGKIVNIENDIQTNTSNIQTNTNNIQTNTNNINLHATRLTHLETEKIHIKISPNWSILTQQFISGNNNYGLQSDIYHITNDIAFNPYTDIANAGAPRHFNYPNKKRLLVKYSINYRSSKGNINTFKSRLIKYTNFANEGNVIKDDETLYQGRDHWHNMDFNNYVMYNDTMIVILDTERESLALETEYFLTTSNGTIDLKCDIEVIEI